MSEFSPALNLESLRDFFIKPSPVPVEQIDSRSVAQLIEGRLKKKNEDVQQRPFSIYDLLYYLGYPRSDFRDFLGIKEKKVERAQIARSRARVALNSLIREEAIETVSIDPEDPYQRGEKDERLLYRVADMQKINKIAIQQETNE